MRLEVITDHNLQLYFIFPTFKPWMKRFNGMFARTTHSIEMVCCDELFWEQMVRAPYARVVRE